MRARPACGCFFWATGRPSSASPLHPTIASSEPTGWLASLASLAGGAAASGRESVLPSLAGCCRNRGRARRLVVHGRTGTGTRAVGGHELVRAESLWSSGTSVYLPAPVLAADAGIPLCQPHEAALAIRLAGIVPARLVFSSARPELPPPFSFPCSLFSFPPTLLLTDAAVNRAPYSNALWSSESLLVL